MMKDVNIIEEKRMMEEFTVLNEDREIRARFGKYIVYQVDEATEIVFQEILTIASSNGQDNIVINSESDDMIKLLKTFTNLPEWIFEEKNFKKVMGSKPKKFMRDICSELQFMFLDYIKHFTKATKTMSEMPEEFMKAYKKVINKKVDEINGIEERKLRYEQLKKEFGEE